MKTTLLVFGFFASLLIISCNEKSSNENTNRKFDILSANPPSSPELFLESFISTDLSERDAALSPNGNEFYYSLWTGTFGIIVMTKKVNNIWTEPQIAPFSNDGSNLEPFISADGQKLYFSSNRLSEPTDEKNDYNIWYVERTGEVWGEPKELGLPANTDRNEFYPSLADNYNLYFTAAYDNSIGGEDIWMCAFVNGEYLEPQNLGENINSKTDEFNAFIAPDESYLIYSSWNREDGFGGGDLYISFKGENNEWKPAINLGEQINSPALDYCPFVTRDGKSFFFTSRKTSKELQMENITDFNHISALLNRPQNGQNDIYWMKSNFIDSLRYRE